MGPMSASVVAHFPEMIVVLVQQRWGLEHPQAADPATGQAARNGDAEGDKEGVELGGHLPRQRPTTGDNGEVVRWEPLVARERDGDGAGDGAEDAGNAVEGMDPAGVLEVDAPAQERADEPEADC